MADKPGKGAFGWLGRQIGYVRRALRSKPGETKVFERRVTQQRAHPNHPNLVLRRTTIDQVVQQEDIETTR
jgi:hypothetical protein